MQGSFGGRGNSGTSYNKLSIIMPKSNDTFLSVSPDGHITFNFAGATVAAHDFQFVNQDDLTQILAFLEATHLLPNLWNLSAALASGESVVILQHNGAQTPPDSSSFLRFTTAVGARSDRIDFGSFGWNWDGSTQMNVVIPHGLGVVPKSVQITQGNGSSLDDFRISNLSSTNITVTVNTPGAPAVGTPDGVYWTAIG
jgi:hypothetical protein